MRTSRAALLALIGLALVAGCAAGSRMDTPEANAADITNSWTGTLWASNGVAPLQVIMNLSQKDGRLTGYMSIPNGSMDLSPMRHIMFREDRLQAELDITDSEGTSYPVYVDLVYAHETLNGTFSSELLKGNISLHHM